MAEISNLFDELITLAEEAKGNNGIWRSEKPVDLMTFFIDPNYLGERPYPGKQTELIETVNNVIWSRFDPNNELTIEEWMTKITEIVVMFGKGSGKDFIASAILTYIVYLLLNLADPQGYFGFGQGEPIDVINMAINAYQANSVFFKKLKARLSSCKWFERVNFDPSKETDKLNGHNNYYQVLKNSIKFYKNITAHSAHSEADSFEGFNPFFVIFDEIGGFEYENAEFAYDTFRSSASTRYQKKFLLIFISFPRHSEDFQMYKWREFEESHDPEVWGIRGASWEVNPSITRENLQKEYDKDPEGARMRFECIPPAALAGFYSMPEKIGYVINVGVTNHLSAIEPVITSRVLNTGEQRNYVGVKLHGLNLDPNFHYYLGGDAGVNTDSYVITLFHAVPTPVETFENGEKIMNWVNKPVQDLVIEWKPSKKDKLSVDLLNVADVVDQICTTVPVKKALFDKFNSAEVVQRLINRGVEAEDKNFSNPFQLQIHTNLKSLIYTGMIELLDNERLKTELEQLKLIGSNKVDHPTNGSKDIADSVAAAVWLAVTDDVEDSRYYSMPVLLGAIRR